MKKILSIVCILLLLAATSNLIVNIHFCGGEISSIDFFGKSKNCGSCDSKDTSGKPSINSKSCCKNLVATITTDDSTTSTFYFQTEQTTTAVIPVIFTYTTEFTFTTEVLKGSIACNAPPDVSAQPYYILYRSLII